MSHTVIKTENLSKVYQLGNFGTGTISRDLERYWMRLRGKEDPFLKIDETNDRSVKGKSDVAWSLRDINFEITQGAAVGIIGPNGAGKSTLLKILSRITAPTTGSIKMRGRIASLLEVGTGFHPELTGRENIYLNGAILGMRNTEIKRKFDEIVDFSGVERYIDTPVKRYSSGMYVRLAFAVAAYLESEILMIDEVLAVGDAEFQKKCLGKMSNLSNAEGRTVLFVSHNMDSIRLLCGSSIVMHQGTISFNGDVHQAIENYSKSSGAEAAISYVKGVALNNSVSIQQFGINKSSVTTQDDLEFFLTLKSNQPNHINSVALLLYDGFDQKVGFIDLRSNELFRQSDISNVITITGVLKNLPLLPGIYKLGMHIQSNLLYQDFFNLLQFEVYEKPLIDDLLRYPVHVRGRVEIDYNFKVTACEI